MAFISLFIIFPSFLGEIAVEIPEKYLATVKQIYQFLLEHDHFLLSGHINADGDAIAAVVAMHLFLQKLGKTSYMIFSDDHLDERFAYLEPFAAIRHFNEINPKEVPIASAVILDVPGYQRLGDVKALLPEKAHVVRIDHHPIEDVMGDIEWVDEEASSTTAMVYEIIAHSGVEVDRELAKAIFTGIVYDTGRFAFSNTTARDFYIASRMVECGANPSEISDIIFFENSIDALRTIGKGLSSMESYLNGAVVVVYLDYETMRTSNPHEIEELTNYSVAVRGAKVGLFVREIKPRFHKISLRSKSNVDVNKVAKAFNGGGHARAAGCRINGDKEEVIRKLLEEIEKHLN